MQFLVALCVFTAFGLAAESVFTGFGDQVRRLRAGNPVDWTLPCRTWLWSVPVYGLSAAAGFTAISAFTPGFFGAPWYIRGLTYTASIYAWEFCWGLVIERMTGTCPWHYRGMVGYRRFVNPRYAPFWFGFGFLLEALHLNVVAVLT